MNVARQMTPDDLRPFAAALRRVVLDVAGPAGYAVGVRIVRELEHLALYRPEQREVYVRESLVRRMDPRSVGTANWWVANMSLAGVLIHEALHVRYSNPDLTDRKALFRVVRESDMDRVVRASLQLEESRIEARGMVDLAVGPLQRQVLRATVLDLVVGDLTVDPNVGGLAHLLALIAARVDTPSGALTGDVAAEGFTSRLRALAGEDRYSAAKDIWLAAQELRTGGYDDLRKLLALGREWCELLESDPDPDGDDGGDSPGEGEPDGDGDGSDGDDSGDGDEPDGDGGDSSGEGGPDGDGTPHEGATDTLDKLFDDLREATVTPPAGDRRRKLEEVKRAAVVVERAMVARRRSEREAYRRQWA